MSRPFSVADIRESYLTFFEAKGCTRHPSAPLVNENDPTTLFTVAGMAQFKDMFLGRGQLSFTRATTCQKCMRTNDILEVGRTPRHHTFFEMLGNFSFNDYFKHETITWAWEYLTEVLGLDASRLRVTVHAIDDESWNIWRDAVGIPESCMERLGDADNFWPANAPLAGPLGPGGCCSEIFWDFTPGSTAASSPGTDSGNRFVEIWNLVFPQFNVREPRQDDGRYTLDDLGRSNVDTGSGLERLACVVQGKTNNFDIDLFQTIIARVCDLTGVAYRSAADDREQAERNALIRRIADHLRAVTFAIADRARPQVTGAGYVVRRLIRRATLDADRLGVDRPVLHGVVGAVAEAMGEAYPELLPTVDRTAGLIEREEEQFRRTLRRGLGLLHKEIERHRREQAGVFDGETAFHLYETDGFPREITEEIVAEAGLHIDDAGWRRAETTHQDRSRSRIAQVFEESDLLDAKGRLGPSEFVGYDRLQTETVIQMLEVAGKAVGSAAMGSEIRFAMSPTPFYAESGGQVGDVGTVEASDGSFLIEVGDVQKEDGVWLHTGRVAQGTARPGPVLARVDAAARAATVRHHSATHLLHSALCRIVGEHVEQQGSRVEPAGLRFDFNNEAAVSDEQLQHIEGWVRERIAEHLPVSTEELPVDEARARGAKALFGEKYGAVVRMVTMGDGSVSIELCGGCHVPSTDQIGAFRILREEASSAGVRRVTAVAGAVARELEAKEAALAQACGALLGLVTSDGGELSQVARLLRAGIDELPERIAALAAEDERLRSELDAPPVEDVGGGLAQRVHALQERLKLRRRTLDERRAAAAAGAVGELLAQTGQLGPLRLLAVELPGADGKALRQAGDTLVTQEGPFCAVLGSTSAGKAALLAIANPQANALGVDAGSLIRRLAPLVGGKGGGRPQMAQGGGPDASGLAAALAAVPDLLADDLGVSRGQG